MTPTERYLQEEPKWAANRQAVLMPTEVSSRVGFFDRFAGLASTVASRAPFFAFCLLLVGLWLVQGAISVAVSGHFSSFLNDKYQLEINTTTTIITFLMVALLQNSQTREDQATQHKLNAVADALADLMTHTSERAGDDTLRRDIVELRAAVGLEDRESTTGNRAGASEEAEASRSMTSAVVRRSPRVLRRRRSSAETSSTTAAARPTARPAVGAGSRRLPKTRTTNAETPAPASIATSCHAAVRRTRGSDRATRPTRRVSAARARPSRRAPRPRTRRVNRDRAGS